jgi:hypothetical protein
MVLSTADDWTVLTPADDDPLLCWADILTIPIGMLLCANASMKQIGNSVEERCSSLLLQFAIVAVLVLFTTSS